MIRRAAAAAVIILTFAVATPAEAHSTGRSRGGRQAGQVNGYPCGGSLPPCFVLMRESRGNPTAQNRRSTASGKWQMVIRTSNTSARAIGRPDLVGRPARTWTPTEQDAAARWLWNLGGPGRGCRHWRAC